MQADTGALHEEGCLFCRRHDGGFASEEHIVSRALGHIDRYVLPPGVVCDRCNRGPLANADLALISFGPIEMLRAERGLPTRTNKPVQVNIGGTRMRWTGSGNLTIVGAGNKVVEGLGPDGGKINLSTGRRVDERFMRSMTHAVWKMALEFLYIDPGPETAFDPKFDPVREAAIGLRQTRGWCLVPVDGKARKDVEVGTVLGLAGGVEYAHVRVDVFGVVFISDLLLRDVDPNTIQAPVPVNVWSFGRSQPNRKFSVLR